ncbi:MAG TPA: MerR family transcriptional regulator [Candidatus Limnocylindria bacterium]|nr:MerR family transcriptional regulator [Candidatus Limnocylindria bacterium]
MRRQSRHAKTGQAPRRIGLAETPHAARHVVAQSDEAVPTSGRCRIGDAARRLQVSTSVLRLWERQGLIRPTRTGAGYRLYSEADLEQLSRVRQMRAVEKVNAPGIRRILGEAGAPADVPAERGPRLRELRRLAGLSLREASRLSGLSAGFISAIERGAGGASVATLQRLTAACGATLQDLFGEAPRGRLVRPHERPALELGEGSVRMEQLAHPGGQLEPHLFVLSVGASSQGAYSHPGEEFIYVLEGRVRVWLGQDEVYDLEAGDSLTFASTLPHSWQNEATSEARLLWINTPPTF